MTDEAMLTTVDNPFDPFEEYDSWYAWDVRMGYNSASLLARITVLSPNTSEPDQSLAIQSAIDEIVSENVSGMHKKVYR